ncbi:uncharacterized protein LOC114324060 [Camellia sinensis]|uniref:uncharacterized protein LOC114324060 n=1 Tax=Camellia sinensis TaxID=4442 RepID=UPI001035C555|nr:uncharacterized protein LOC114324060 [Camellia sinensis]
MLRFGYKQSNADYTMFVKHNAHKVTVLIVYMDNIVVTGNDEEDVTHLKIQLAKEFEIKDLGPLRKYILDLLAETGMLGCKPADSPIEVNHHLCNVVGNSVEKESYQRLVGRLIYVSHTQSDIAYAASVLEAFTDADWAGSVDDRSI